MQSLVTLLFVACAGIFYWHHKEIKKLKSKVHALEQKNKKMMGKA